MNRSMAADIDVSGSDLIGLMAIVLVLFVVLPLLARFALRERLKPIQLEPLQTREHRHTTRHKR